ncbi:MULTISPECIES: DUF739 family protein [Fructobacillus]|uniref:DUF739 family protein n=1 Tax=Fructobacillus TaxID=559173 RepID=UPI00064D9F5A|nr:MULTISPECIES: DUF739 family protein [Fructobacillus]KMK52759.1 hypothetical protein FEFB_15070 [Fructobacillus sp. EFB-N1]MCK8639040.1 DUF739 family protein [Fructobacillus fructosus]CAK1254609.1 DNA-binding transcriptional regulator [Fructobacillus tropaeoli]
MIKFNYERLYGRMKSKGFNQSSLARKIGISAGTMTNKLKGQPFKQDEILNICNVLDIADEDMSSYFFTIKVQKTEQATA